MTTSPHKVIWAHSQSILVIIMSKGPTFLIVIFGVVHHLLHTLYHSDLEKINDKIVLIIIVKRYGIIWRGIKISFNKQASPHE